ncbi:MAG: DUF2079 domain-containing protein [Bowdeniella nasicola]|nr:DUF2079 domain-containing protein [Bowdeniella nasicola]
MSSRSGGWLGPPSDAATAHGVRPDADALSPAAGEASPPRLSLRHAETPPPPPLHGPHRGSDEDSAPLWRWARIAVVAAVTFAVLTWISHAQWVGLISPSWDLGIFTQLADAYAHLRAPIVPIKGEGYHLLGDHFHPILIALGPIYRLAPSAFTLLVVQNALFACTAGLVVRGCERRGYPIWVGLCLGLSAGLGWATQFAVAAEFHEVCAALPWLTLALFAYLEDRPVAAAGWMAPLVFVKEDLGITVALFGLLIAARARSVARRAGSTHDGETDDAHATARARATRLDPTTGQVAGVTLAAWGVIWSVLAIGVILPAFNVSGHYDYTGRLGLPLTDLLAPGPRWLLVGLLIVTAGGLGVLSPLAALMLPTLTWRFLGDVPFYWWIGWHYDAILMPIAIAALLDGADRLARLRGGAEARWKRRRITHSFRSGQAHANQRPLRPRAHPITQRSGLRAQPTLALAVLINLSATALVAESLPIWELSSAPDRPVGTTTAGARLDAAHDIMALVDAESAAAGRPISVMSDLTLMARLVPHARVYWVRETRVTPRLIVVDRYCRAWGKAYPEDISTWAAQRFGVTYDVIVEREGFQVARRVS